MSRTICFLLAFVVVLATGQQLGQVKKRQMQLNKQIADSLFAGNKYDHEERPDPENAYSSVIVTVHAHVVNSQFDFDDLNADITMYFRQLWRDKRLSYQDQRDELNDRLLLPHTKKIWTPDTYFASVDATENQDKHSVTVGEDGLITMSTMYTVEFTCKRHPSYPLINRLSCSTQMGSYNYDMSDVYYRWRRFRSVQYDANSHVADVKTGNCTSQYEIGQYSCLSMEIVYGWCGMNSVARLLLPTLVLVIISWLHFFLPISCTVARPLSALLPVVVIALIMAGSLAEMSSLGVSIWFTVCLLFTLLSALEYFGVLALKTCPEHEQVHEQEAPLKGTRLNVPDRSRWDLLSRVFFPGAFAIFLVIYLIYFLLIA